MPPLIGVLLKSCSSHHPGQQLAPLVPGSGRAAGISQGGGLMK
jgi:hypothetical protein